jgi:hypothetical protein
VTIRNEKGEVIATATTVADTATIAAEKQLSDLYVQHTAALRAEIAAGGATYGTTAYQHYLDLQGEASRVGRQVDDFKNGMTCTVVFRAQVPIAQFYQTKVGTHDAPTYSFDELKAQNFNMQLSLK